MRNILLLLCCICTQALHAQLSGRVLHAGTGQPLEGVTVQLQPVHVVAITNTQGRFTFKRSAGATTILFTNTGFRHDSMPLSSFKGEVKLLPQAISLNTITVATHLPNPYQAISKLDIARRGITNSQEVLRIVPGLFIGQHQGGGKAEQIFLRGFDCDHGTDISLMVDGLPINMVSHAHGQGFADSHFIIPETIEGVSFKKGPYYAEKGDFATTGYVDFHTKDALEQNEIKLEGGMFNTWRALGMFNLLPAQTRARQQSWYIAGEYRYSDAYFDAPQYFNRYNLFTKYTSQLSTHTTISAQLSTFRSSWRASGQIPDRTVKTGRIGWFGAIDPNEGGKTGRTNASVALLHTFANGDQLKNQVYYSRYDFSLRSDFTFFLVDTVNGDAIRQQEKRDLAGYRGSYEHTGYIGQAKLVTNAGIQVRADGTHNSRLSHIKGDDSIINRIKLGDIRELNTGAYVSETLLLNERLSLNAGLRFDEFFYGYHNKLATDSTLPGIGRYHQNGGVVSPKLSLYYHVNKNTECYLTTGKGFHSNDARGVVAQQGVQVLPSAYGADLGTVVKPTRNLLLNAAIWYIYLQQEFVYGGDGGTVEFSSPTHRNGFDLSARYQPIAPLYIDVDVNYAHGRSADAPKGAGYIPLAPEWSSTGGITYTLKNGINGSLRYRYLANRPANEDYSLTAKGYVVTDFVLNYTKHRYEAGLTINNLLNTKWKETQFDTETRLKGEAHPVDEICFTPGTPFSAKLSLSFYF